MTESHTITLWQWTSYFLFSFDYFTRIRVSKFQTGKQIVLEVTTCKPIVAWGHGDVSIRAIAARPTSVLLDVIQTAAATGVFPTAMVTHASSPDHRLFTLLVPLQVHDWIDFQAGEDRSVKVELGKIRRLPWWLRWLPICPTAQFTITELEKDVPSIQDVAAIYLKGCSV